MPPFSKKAAYEEKLLDSVGPSNFSSVEFLVVMQKISPFIHDSSSCLANSLNQNSETHFLKTLMKIKFDCERVLQILKQIRGFLPDIKVNLERLRPPKTKHQSLTDKTQENSDGKEANTKKSHDHASAERTGNDSLNGTTGKRRGKGRGRGRGRGRSRGRVRAVVLHDHSSDDVSIFDASGGSSAEATAPVDHTDATHPVVFADDTPPAEPFATPPVDPNKRRTRKRRTNTDPHVSDSGVSSAETTLRADPADAPPPADSSAFPDSDAICLILNDVPKEETDVYIADEQYTLHPTVDGDVIKIEDDFKIELDNTALNSDGVVETLPDDLYDDFNDDDVNDDDYVNDDDDDDDGQADPDFNPDSDASYDGAVAKPKRKYPYTYRNRRKNNGKKLSYPYTYTDGYLKPHCYGFKRQDTTRYMCRLCRSVYSPACGESTGVPTIEEIESHKETDKCISSQSIEKCEECESMGFEYSDTKIKIRQHRRAHVAPFQCKKCSFLSNELEAIQNHLKTHFVEQSFFRCGKFPKCSERFDDLESLKEHYFKKHDEDAKSSHCFLCYKVVVNTQLHRHINQHLKISFRPEKKPRLKCKNCDFQTRLYPALIRHEKVHILPYICRKKRCDFKADSIAAYREHFVELHRSERTFVCKLCDKSFGRREKLLAHIDTHDRQKDEEDQRFEKFKQMPSRYEAFKCFICDEEIYRATYTAHILTHIKPQGKLYKCQSCSMEFVQRSYLLAHKASVHDRVSRYHCHACSFSTYNNSSLTSHLKARHESGGPEGPKKRFACPLSNCNKSYNHKEIYEQHLAFHERRRKKPKSRYHCDKCGMGFTRWGNLERHSQQSLHPIPDHYFENTAREEAKRRLKEEMLARENDPETEDKEGEEPPGEGGEGGEKEKKPRIRKTISNGKLKKNGEKYAPKRNQKWTDEEDDWICAGVREMGKGSWKEILDKYKEHFHESRDRFTVRLRYAYLEKRGHVDEPGVLKDKSLVVDGRKHNKGGYRKCLKEVDGRYSTSGHCKKETDMRRFNGGRRVCKKEFDKRRNNGGYRMRDKILWFKKKMGAGSKLGEEESFSSTPGGESFPTEGESLPMHQWSEGKEEGESLPMHKWSEAKEGESLSVHKWSEAKQVPADLASNHFPTLESQEMFSPSPSPGIQPSPGFNPGIQPSLFPSLNQDSLTEGPTANSVLALL